MTCEEMRALFEPLLDNELETKETDLVTDHVQACHLCADELAEMTAMRDLITRGMWDFATPDDLVSRVRNTVAAEAAIHSRRQGGFRSWILPATASFAALGALAVFAVATFADDAQPESETATVPTQLIDTPMRSARPLLVSAQPKWGKPRVGNARPKPRYLGAREGLMNGHRVLELKFSVGDARLYVRRIAQAPARMARAQYTQINGRHVWVKRVRDVNMASVADFDGDAWVFMSRDLSRTELVDLVHMFSITGY